MTYFILLVAGLLVLAGAALVLSARIARLPRFRVRYLRLRLHLRLHPGRGHATCVRAVAAVGPAGRVPPLAPVPPVAAGRGSGWPARMSTAWRSAGRSTGTGCGCRSRSTC